MASWFAEGVAAEIAALEKQGGEQRYELLSGQLIRQEPTSAVYRFIVADASRVPEDAVGRR